MRIGPAEPQLTTTGAGDFFPTPAPWPASYGPVSEAMCYPDALPGIGCAVSEQRTKVPLCRHFDEWSQRGSNP